MGANDQLIQVNQTLELAAQQLNELLRSVLISSEQISRIQSINNRIRELENDPDFEKMLPELDQLYTELRGLKEHLSAVLQESLSSEQLEKLKQNIYLLSEPTQRLTQAPPEPERVEAAIRHIQGTLAAIAGDPTIPPSLLHILKQSLEELDNHTETIRKMLNSKTNSDLSLEMKDELWKNALRLSKTAGVANKWMGIDVNEFPFDDFWKDFADKYHYDYPYFHLFFVEHYFTHFYKCSEKIRLQIGERKDIFLLYLVLEIHTRFISTWFKKEYHALPADIECPDIKFQNRYLYRILNASKDAIHSFLSNIENI